MAVCEVFLARVVIGLVKKLEASSVETLGNSIETLLVEQFTVR